jgi:UDP-N-acetylglucosamine 2-epimerase (non-hydrolysing)
MKKLMLIFGTRPEAIKLAPIIYQLKYHNYILDEKTNLTGARKFATVICVTGQHREMLDQVLKVFNITPQYDLNTMTESQDLFDVSLNSLAGIKDILKNERPDIVVVQGDTTTAFIASLAAYYFKIPVAHIEAGLRTYNKYSPFPEEKNRHLLSVLADYHFAPTEWAKNNLLKENIPEDKIWVTGNTVIDALLLINKRQKSKNSQKYWLKYFKEKWSISLITNNQKLILVTGHRRENFGKGFENICLALKEIAEKRHDVLIVYPVHLNPNVQKPVKSILNGKPNIHLIDPLEYEPFVFLTSYSYIILTDSGGIQEEAPSFGKPVLVMRNTTERPEGIKTGAVRLVGTEKNKIINETIKLLENRSLYNKMSKSRNPYGDGKAAERIVNILGALFKC